MATDIIQQPLFTFVPVGQELIYTVSNQSTVANQEQVKFVAEVYISADVPPTLTGSTNKVATFKTTPNNAGVGIFDFREVIETFVKADHLAYELSEYKEETITANDYVPIHLIDKASRAANSIKYLGIKFSTERFSSSLNTLVQEDEVNSEIKKIFNGYLGYNEQLREGTLPGEEYYYGYNMLRFNLNGSSKEFLTNAPDTQYANQGDYGTSAIMLGINGLFPATDGAVRIKFTYFTYLSGSFSEFYEIKQPNGGPASNSQMSLIYNNILFFGVFPGNLQNWSTMYNGIGTDIDYYTFKIEGDGGVDLSKEYTINVNCPESIPGGSSAFPVTPRKGYEPIRLCWLNQWGAWDYYTFTLKSTKTITTKGTTYNQLGGSWNNNVYRYQMHKGGKKTFRVNATEKLKINTDYITEEDAVWLEELMNSPETYMILKGYDTSEPANSILNDYMCPVRLLTKSYVKKTVANDKLIQYTFEVEKSKKLRTQSI